jgi:hypothetical protein
VELASDYSREDIAKLIIRTVVRSLFSVVLWALASLFQRFSCGVREVMVRVVALANAGLRGRPVVALRAPAQQRADLHLSRQAERQQAIAAAVAVRHAARSGGYRVAGQFMCVFHVHLTSELCCVQLWLPVALLPELVAELAGPTPRETLRAQRRTERACERPGKRRR